MKVWSGSQRRSTLARLLLAQDVNRRRQRTSIAAWSLLHKMEWMPSFLTVSTISYIRLVTGWDGVNNDNNNNKNLHEVSSKGLGEVQASCCCRWPCCPGGSPGLRTTGRDLGGAWGQQGKIETKVETFLLLFVHHFHFHVQQVQWSFFMCDAKNIWPLYNVHPLPSFLPLIYSKASLSTSNKLPVFSGCQGFWPSP